MSQDWHPASNEEKSLKDALDGLQTSINSVVKNVDKPELASRFILNSKGFYDLRAYVLSMGGRKSRGFPQDDGDFDRQIPPNAFADITTFDNEIYPLTKKTMVGIGSSCKDFYQNQLVKLVNVSSAAVQYTESATDVLVMADCMNLRYYLEILLQDQYKNKADQDEEFEQSRDAALMLLQRVKEDADMKKRDIDDIRAELLSFHGKIFALERDVELLTKQFKTGPVQNNSTDQAKKKPYIDQLDENYNTKIKEIRQQSAAQTKNSEWETKTGVDVGLAEWPGIGWVVMNVTAAEAAATRNAYNELKSTIEQGQRKNSETISLLMNVTTMIEQYTDIDHGAIHPVMSALGELGKLYANHSVCYNNIASYLNSTIKGGKDCKSYVHASLWKTSEWLEELKKTALEFQQNIVREIRI